MSVTITSTRGGSDGILRFNYIDSIGVAGDTYVLPFIADSVTVTNLGDVSLIAAGYTVLPRQSKEIIAQTSSLVISASSKIVSFRIEGEETSGASTNVSALAAVVESYQAESATELDALGANKADKSELVITDGNVTATNLRVDNLVIPISAENANIAVTDALVSTVKSKTFSTLRNRHEETETDTLSLLNAQVDIENLLANGTFVNTVGWTPITSGFSVATNIATLLPTATNGGMQASYTGTAGDIYYVKAEVSTTSTFLYVSLTGTKLASAKHSGSGTYETIASNFTSIANAVNFRILDALTSAWPTTLVKNFVAMNLTKIFGAGNEPTASEITWMLGIFNGYFSGEKRISQSHVLDMFTQSKNDLLVVDNKITSINQTNGDKYKYYNQSKANISIEDLLLESEIPLAERDYTIRARSFNYGWKISSPTGTIIKALTFATPKDLTKASALILHVYIVDATKISTIGLDLSDTGGVKDWKRASTTPVNGWNILRWTATEGTMNLWELAYSIAVRFTCTETVSVYIGGIYMEKNDKARILLVEDGGYPTFLSIGYPQLKARGFHTTWALNPGRLGDFRITEADVDSISGDSLSYWSWHSWTSDIHADIMPSREVADNATKCMRWIQAKGLQPKYWFRGAITQNVCTNHAILQDMIEAYATPVSAMSLTNFPFQDPYNVPRLSIKSSVEGGLLPSLFANLKKTHGVAVFYLHGISDDLADISVANWNVFIAQLDLALAEGWIESVTYDILRIRLERQFGGYGYDNLFKKVVKD